MGNYYVNQELLENGKITLYQRVIRGKVCSVWNCSINIPNYKRIRESLQTESFSEAKLLSMERYKLYKARSKEGMLIRPSSSFLEIVNSFLAKLKDNATSNKISYRKFRDCKSSFDNYFVPFFKQFRIQIINDETVSDYLTWRRKKNAIRTGQPANATLNRENIYLRKFFRFAHRNGQIKREPIIPTFNVKLCRSSFGSSDWKKIINKLDSEIGKKKIEYEKKKCSFNDYILKIQLKTLVELMGYSGIRVNKESNQNLKWEDFDLVLNNGKKLRIATQFDKKLHKNLSHLEIKIKHPKPKTPKRLAIGLKCLEPPLQNLRALTNFPDGNDYVFCHQSGRMAGKPIGDFKKQFRSFLNRYNLYKAQNGKTRNLTSCRHEFIEQRLVNSDIPLNQLALSVGSSIAIIEKYYSDIIEKKYKKNFIY